jgi:cobalt-zinc-cadmium efflux system protein
MGSSHDHPHDHGDHGDDGAHAPAREGAHPGTPAHAGHGQGHAHGHGHGHGHGHAHSHAPKDVGRAFAIGVLLNTGFVAGEVVYGLRSDSLALLADAGHNLSDVLGLLLAWGASVLVKRAATARFTYGLRGTSILAAVANAVLLTLVTAAIAWQAVARLRHPAPVQGVTVMAVAAVGIAVNLATALLFMAGRNGDLNVRAAFAHMAGDAAIAAGVVVAGFAMLQTGWLWLDPVVSLAIALIVIGATWGLLKDSIVLALQGVPREVDATAVGAWLSSRAGVAEVHELHIWAMSTTENALTAHLVYPGGFPGDDGLRQLCAELRAHHPIAHVTIQVETGQPGECCGAVAAAGDGAASVGREPLGLWFRPRAAASSLPASGSGAAPRSHPARP